MTWGSCLFWNCRGWLGLTSHWTLILSAVCITRIGNWHKKSIEHGEWWELEPSKGQHKQQLEYSRNSLCIQQLAIKLYLPEEFLKYPLQLDISSSNFEFAFPMHKTASSILARSWSSWLILPMVGKNPDSISMSGLITQDPLCSPRFNLATPTDSSFSCTYSNALETHAHGVGSYYIALVVLL